MDSIDQDFIKFYQEVGKANGMDELTATLFARLFIEPDEIAMSELAEETGYSLASISNKIRFLEISGYVVRSKKPGTKKIYLYGRKEILDVVIEQISNVRTNEIKKAKSEIPSIIEHYNSENLNESQKQKITILRGYYNDLLKIDDIFEDMVKKIEEIKSSSHLSDVGEGI